MSGQDTRTREQRVRRAAQRRDLGLSKSRTHDPHAWDFNRWTIVDPFGVWREPALTLEEVEAFLERPEREEKRQDMQRVAHGIAARRPEFEFAEIAATTREVFLEGAPDSIAAVVADVDRRLDERR